MKASNQGFVDLHTPYGFFLIGSCFLLISVVIIVGAIVFKNIAAKEKLMRAELKANQDLKRNPKV